MMTTKMPQHFKNFFIVPNPLAKLNSSKEKDSLMSFISSIRKNSLINWQIFKKLSSLNLISTLVYKPILREQFKTVNAHLLPLSPTILISNSFRKKSKSKILLTCLSQRVVFMSRIWNILFFSSFSIFRP